MLTSPHFSAETRVDETSRDLPSRLARTRARIAAAATRYGRDADSIGLVAVSKTQPAAAIRTLAQAGQRDFGENYLQEAVPKLAELSDLPIVWHYIGQLQANKTRAVAEHFHWVHTVDRERIAVRLNEQRPHYAAPLNICIQVRLEDEPGKGGVSPAEAASLARAVSSLPRLKLRGLMCIPPPRDTFDEQRALFAALGACQRQLIAQGFALDTLSMGMSADLEAAVAAGATWVRIGTAIFGERTRQ
jgi:pyridoxal phosphate enzyme (YggS family)